MTSGAIRRDFVTNPIRFWEVTEEQSQKFFEVNAIAPFTIAASLVPEMMRRKWCRIINVTTSLDNMLRPGMVGRSEEHTSELQSLMRISYAVFCLKKKKTKTKHNTNTIASCNTQQQ